MDRVWKYMEILDWGIGLETPIFDCEAHLSTDAEYDQFRKTSNGA